MYTYTAYSNNQDGTTFEYNPKDLTTGLKIAIKRAKRYARSSFSVWINGYGPTIVIALDGKEVHKETL